MPNQWNEVKTYCAVTAHVTSLANQRLQLIYEIKSMKGTNIHGL